MSRRVHLSPTFTLVDEESLPSIERKIGKVKPTVEVTLEGMTEIAKGRIVEWHANRHFFAAHWDQRSDAFAAKIESRSELRAFFKGQLFSTQVVFKTMTVRRLSDEVYHFRIPEQIYQQQRRGALRVPVTGTATLVTPKGEFDLLDLSVGGAKLKLAKPSSKLGVGVALSECELKLGRKKIGNLTIKITSETEGSLGCRFSGLEHADQITIKQYLIEALRTYYKESL